VALSVSQTSLSYLFKSLNTSLLRGGYFIQFHFVVKRLFVNFLFNTSNQTCHTHTPSLRLAFRFQLTVSSPPRQHRVGMGRIIGRFFKGATTKLSFLLLSRSFAYKSLKMTTFLANTPINYLYFMLDRELRYSLVWLI
jgi:hypothetical protein